MADRKNQPKCAVCGGKDLTNAEWEARMVKIRAWQQEQMETYGFWVDLVLDGGANGLVNIHTHGLPESLGHPDFQIVINVGQRAAMTTFHRLVQMLQDREVKKFEPGIDYDNVIHDFKIRFIRAGECGRDVLRVIVPDKHGNLDREKLPEPFSTQYEQLVME